MLRFLLDTNVLSEITRPQPNPGILRRFRQHAAEFALSAPSYAEMAYGVLKLSKDHPQRLPLAKFLMRVTAQVPILPYDQQAARWHARENAHLQKKTPSPKDGWIAAVAGAHDLVLVTHNVANFADYDLPIEDWWAAS